VHFDLQGQSLIGQTLKTDKAQSPITRASMSAAVHEGKLWVFGGQDEDNNKLNDLWCFDKDSVSWSQIKPKAGDFAPLHRSGHTTVSYGGKMYIFGGIVELTKELNDLIVFDFSTGKFSGSDESNQGHHGSQSPLRTDVVEEETNSPSPVRRATIVKTDGKSPIHLGGTAKLRSSNFSKSPSKSLKAGLTVNTNKHDETIVKGELLTPTSVSMKNSFIVKNSDDSFIAYGKAMDKRHKKNAAETITSVANKSALVRGNKPTPRDGHSATVDSRGYMFVFGGDRHHMPFNDLYMIKLE